MTAHFRGSTEERNGNDSLALVDLENLQDDEESNKSGFVSPRELTKINFRSLIGHTDEVHVQYSNTVHVLYYIFSHIEV